MNPDSNRELIEIKELVKENHRILRKLQSRARWGTIVHSLKWIVIVLVSLGIFAYLQPVFSGLMDAYSALHESASNIAEIKSNLPSGFDFGKLFGGEQ